MEESGAGKKMKGKSTNKIVKVNGKVTLTIFKIRC